MSVSDSTEENTSRPPPAPTFHGSLLEARNLTLQSRRGEQLAKDVSFYIRPGEMVVLTGPETPALSALLQSLAGLLPKKDLQVFVDQVSLGANLKAFRSRIGYVPREDTLPEGDTVREVFQDAAWIYLPRETPAETRRTKMEQVLADFGLQEVKSTRIGKLPEFQKRLVSVAIQVIKSPTYLLVDECGSASDAYSDIKLARILHHLAQNGLTTVMVSRSPAAAQLADKVAVLAPGGVLAWYGPPGEALAYFKETLPEAADTSQTVSFDVILPYLEAKNSQAVSGKDWGKRFKAHPAYEQNSINPLSSKRPDLLLQDRPLSRLRGVEDEPQAPRAIRQASAASQFFTLTGRSLRSLTRTSTGLMAVLAPLLAAVVILLVSSPRMLDPFEGDPWRAGAVSGLLVFFGLLIPAVIFSQHLIRERAAFRRDRRQNVSLIAYLLSKLWVVGLFGVYQSLVLSLGQFIGSGMAGGFISLPIYWITLFFLSVVGGLLGLLASAIASTPLSATGIALLLVIPQVILGGVINPITETNPASRLLSMMMPARHAFEAVLTGSGFGQDLVTDPCWQLTAEQQQALTDGQKQACTCQGTNVFSRCTFPGVYQAFSPAIEQNEPEAPTLGADVRLPVQPVLRDGITLEQYANEINGYTLALESYQGTLDRYISNLREYAQDLSTWQRSRSLAIGRAEGQIAQANQRFGPFLGVSLAANWITLIGFSFLFFVLLAIAQKGKGAT